MVTVIFYLIYNAFSGGSMTMVYAKQLHDWKRWAALLALLTFLFVKSASPAKAQASGSPTVWLPLMLRTKTRSNPIHQGIATYYDATGAGACSFDPTPNDLMVAAMNNDEYDNASVCGEYLKVTGPKGTITIRIVDLCPECKAGHLDLSREAFASIAELPQGVVPITWQVISPDLNGPIAYHFKNGSNQWWTAVQIRNHRNPIARFEYRDSGGKWVAVPREPYNYFVQTEPGMGLGPYTFRVTDSYGNVLIDSGIPLTENGTVNGAAQFPAAP
jgi:expansin (peptidoglycan-binding protein)